LNVFKTISQIRNEEATPPLVVAVHPACSKPEAD